MNVTSVRRGPPTGGLHPGPQPTGFGLPAELEYSMQATPALARRLLDWVALIERLTDADRESLLGHFLSFDAADRRLRFGLPVSDAHIVRYVESLDFERSHVYGVRAAGPGDEWLGIGHLIEGDNQMAELGLSVLPAARGHGLGSAIFRYAVAQAARTGVRRLYMHFLTSNNGILTIARNARMSIDASGGEADAFLVVPSHEDLISQLIGDTSDAIVAG